MGFLVLFLTVVIVLQVGILLFCWLHRRDPLAAIPREQRAAVLIRLLKTRNAIRGIWLFADAMLRQQYGKLTVAQVEFLHQISSFTAQAKRTLDELTDRGGPLSRGKGTEEKHVKRERGFHPPSYSILSILDSEESRKARTLEP